MAKKRTILNFINENQEQLQEILEGKKSSQMASPKVSFPKKKKKAILY